MDIAERHMTSHVLTPCPKCGRRFDFPLTGCVTFVADNLLATTGGNCPDCGARVVVDELPPEAVPHNPITAAKTRAEIRAVKIVDLNDLSVRSRSVLIKLPAETIGDLIDLGRSALRGQLDRPRFAEIDELFEFHRINW